MSVDKATLGGQGQPSRAPTALSSVCWRRRGLGAAGMSWRTGGESAEGILVEGSSSKVGGHTACLCALRDPPIGGRKQAAGRPRILLNMEPLPGEPQGDDAEKWEEVEGNSRADCTCGPGARGGAAQARVAGLEPLLVGSRGSRCAVGVGRTSLG